MVKKQPDGVGRFLRMDWQHSPQDGTLRMAWPHRQVCEKKPQAEASALSFKNNATTALLSAWVIALP